MCHIVSNVEVLNRNVEVLNQIHTKLHFREDMMKRKLAYAASYAGHVLSGSSGLSHLQILEGPMEGKKRVGSP